jgi:hypothetical protein
MTRIKKSRLERGSALMTSVLLISVMLVVTAGVLFFAGQERRRAIQLSRAIPRNYCVETGMQMARTYFGANQATWNTYLSAPTQYNPVASTTNTTPADPSTTALQTARPELFADLDGDGLHDVYIYIRDNQDDFTQFKEATRDDSRDNDLQVIVGAVCISSTLVPKREDGKPSPVPQTSEGILQYTPPGADYAEARKDPG